MSVAWAYANSAPAASLTVMAEGEPSVSAPALLRGPDSLCDLTSSAWALGAGSVLIGWQGLTLRSEVSSASWSQGRVKSIRWTKLGLALTRSSGEPTH
jgi:hypothetical protein